MKRCSACGEYLPSQFSFCPIDGKPVAENVPATTCEYQLTLLSERSLVSRLGIEAQFLFERLQKAWPHFKAEPLTFTQLQLIRFQNSLRRTLTQPYVATASLMAAAIIVIVVLSAVLFDRQRSVATHEREDEELVPTTMIDFQNDQKADSKPGVGTGKDGRVGFDKGRGEGSGPKPARAQGGGGGGDLSQLPQSQGRLPVPSVIPAPIPTTYARVSLPTLPAAGLNIDPVLWKDLPFRDYGDPRSKSTTPSNGPGKDGGVGTGEGTGIGEGKGTGVGPGNKRNIGGGEPNDGCCGRGGSPDGNNPNLDVDRVYRVTEVTTRARVLSKPEPQYTEEARKSQITGTVTLSVVFSRTGEVTNIRAVQPLCCGLTEKAISAARQIRFIPATRAGQAVSTRMQLEYNFNLY